jgi:hypothetical protein
MIELLFQRDLYDAAAVEEAAKVYGAYAGIELAHGASGDVVRVTMTPEQTAPGADEATVSAELMNYALGLTIERMNAADAAAQEAAR